mmetsp:Transcript_15911/g.24221  ORF Transcript_15911/g.24221 Transcript_15911/m.24221 type:complete len:176 (+) Transcript_15911:83-610(+)
MRCMMERAGMNHLCPENKAAARMTLSFDGNGWDLGGTIQNVVQNNVCVSRVEWDRASTSLDCNDAECRLKEAYKFQGINIKKQQTTTRNNNNKKTIHHEFTIRRGCSGIDSSQQGQRCCVYPQRVGNVWHWWQKQCNYFGKIPIPRDTIGMGIFHLGRHLFGTGRLYRCTNEARL